MGGPLTPLSFEPLGVEGHACEAARLGARTQMSSSSGFSRPCPGPPWPLLCPQKPPKAKEDLHIHIHSSIIHSSQKVEATQVSTNGWKDKQNVVYPKNEISFRFKKEENPATCYNMDESCGMMLSEISQS